MHTPELVGLHGKHGQHEDTVHSKLCYDGVGGGGGGAVVSVHGIGMGVTEYSTR